MCNYVNLKGKTMSISKELARRDTAIEIMAMTRGKKMNALVKEMTKPEAEKNQDEIDRINAELDVLDAERIQMYKGNEKIISKILDVYGNQIKEERRNRKKQKFKQISNIISSLLKAKSK